jgi:hypothetical protein
MIYNYCCYKQIYLPSLDHNRIHAADVMHVCYYLSTQQIPYFVPTQIENNAKSSGRFYLIKKYLSIRKIIEINFNRSTQIESN